MLQNARVTDFTVSELLREYQQGAGGGGGGKKTPRPPKKLELSSWPTTLGLVLKLINYIAFS